MKQYSLFVSALVLGGLFANSAEAITLPDSGSCSSSGICLSISNSSTGSAASVTGSTGLQASGSSYGIYASSSNYAVYGTSTTGSGIGANSSSGAAVYATSSSGAGVTATSVSSDGVKGTSGSSSNSGVYGLSTNHGYGVAGRISPTGGGYAIYGDNTAVDGYAGYFHGNLQVTGTPYCSGCTTFTNNSDIRLKKDVRPLAGALDTLLKLRPVTFEWQDPEAHGGQTGIQRGFIAQEVEKVLPEWVGVDRNGYKTLNTRGLEAMLVESLAELKSENNSLRERVKTLEERRMASVPVGNLTLGALGMVGAALILSKRKRNSEQ